MKTLPMPQSILDNKKFSVNGVDGPFLHLAATLPLAMENIALVRARILFIKQIVCNVARNSAILPVLTRNSVLTSALVPLKKKASNAKRISRNNGQTLNLDFAFWREYLEDPKIPLGSPLVTSRKDLAIPDTKAINVIVIFTIAVMNTKNGATVYFPEIDLRAKSAGRSEEDSLLIISKDGQRIPI